MRLGLALAIVAGTSLVSLAAFANEGGVAGYTGKPSSLAPQGESCNQCHAGGTAPQVSITGPASLEAGKAAEYTLVVATGQTRAAGAVAATDGVLLSPSVGGGFRDSFGEMVQDASKTVANGQATFTFRVTAPTTVNTLRLWATGLAANGAGTAGDRATSITRDIAVVGGLPAPAPDGGASSSSGANGVPPGVVDGGGTGSTSSSGDVSGATGEPDPDEAEADGEGTGTGTGSGHRRLAAPQAGACAEAPALGSNALDAAAGVALALAGLRRWGRKRAARTR